jgi:hypothetical protein
MDCVNIWYYTFTDFWILTRTQDYRTNPNTSGKYQELLQRANEKYGVVIEELIETIQTDCDYDYAEIYPETSSSS